MTADIYKYSYNTGLLTCISKHFFRWLAEKVSMVNLSGGTDVQIHRQKIANWIYEKVLALVVKVDNPKVYSFYGVVIP